MARNNKVVQYKKPFTINVGVIIFIIIFLYLAIQIFVFLGTEHLSTYEVTENKISADNIYTGIILRDETLMTTGKSGYINYYVGEGERVKKNSTIYSIDESGKMYQLLATNDSEYILSSDDIKEVRECIANYKNNFESYNYQQVYNFKYGIENTVLNLNNSNMLDALNKLLADNGAANTFQVVKSDMSGIISYNKDGFEGVTKEQLNEESFSQENYDKMKLRSSDKKEAGSDVYKMVTSDNWSIVIPLSEAQYASFQETKRINVTFLKDKRKVAAGITTYTQDGKFYAELSFDKYMIQYLSDRFIQVELNISNTSGLKIPNTSITEKLFYKVPSAYFTKGDNNSNTGVVKMSYKENGEIATEFIATDLVYEEEDYGYVSGSILSAGDILISASADTNGEKYTVTETVMIQGVYNVNKGYPVFKRVEVIKDNTEYSIVKSGTKAGISLYDYIILNAKYAEENNFIK